jgi:hypothetical protein
MPCFEILSDPQNEMDSGRDYLCPMCEAHANKLTPEGLHAICDSHCDAMTIIETIDARTKRPAMKGTLYPGRALTECVAAETREIFDLEPCPECGNSSENEFKIATMGHKLYAMQCQVCGQTGPETCHVNGCIAFMRWCTWVEEQRHADQQ